MPNNTKLGEARVDVTADTSDLQSKLSDAKTQVDDFGRASEKSARKARRSFSQVSEEMQAVLSRQAGVITGFVGVGAAIAGIGFTAFRAGRQIRDAFTGAEVQRFRDQVGGAERSLDAMIDRLRAAGKEADGAFQTARGIADAYQKDVDDIVQEAAAAVDARGAGQIIRDGLIEGFESSNGLNNPILGPAGGILDFANSLAGSIRGETSEILDVAAENLEDRARKFEVATTQASRNRTIEARRSARELIRAAEDIGDVQLIGTQQGSEKNIADLQSLIDQLKASIDDLQDDDGTLAGELQSAVSAVELRKVRALQEQSEAADRREQEARDAIAQQVKDEIQAFNDDRLSPTQKRINDLTERAGELEDQLGEFVRPENINAVQERLGQITTEIQQLRDEQQTQARDIGQEVERAVTNSLTNAGILAAINNLNIATQTLAGSGR